MVDGHSGWSDMNQSKAAKVSESAKTVTAMGATRALRCEWTMSFVASCNVEFLKKVRVSHTQATS